MRRLPLLSPRTAPQVLADWPAEPPWPHAPTVEWQICGHCNYDCSYCIQSQKHRVGYPTAAQIDQALTLLSGLDGRWEIKTTGGEPFASPLFLRRVVPGLMATPHTMSTLTNLSAPPRILEEFAGLTHGRLAVVSASLHLEYTGVDDFLNRLTVLRDAVHASTRIVVNSVLVPGRLPAVAEARARVEAAGFRFFPQWMKIKGERHAYDEADMRWVRRIVGDLDLAAERRSANLAPDYAGRACYTGARYFVLLQDGSAWSCRSARRHGEGALGNAYTGDVSLRTGPVRCAYAMCPCAVPANRGMIEGVAARAGLAEVDA
ncbi:MAG: radical SAM protein [Myxococcales bacterium]|nr:radical SAM protein [Myxococcales bacterium]